MKTLNKKKSGITTHDIDSSGALDIDAGTGKVSIDSASGSITMGAVLTDGQTLKLGSNGATEMIFTPHGTAGTEKISLINTAGTATDALKIEATAGGITFICDNFQFKNSSGHRLHMHDVLTHVIHDPSTELTIATGRDSWITIPSTGELKTTFTTPVGVTQVTVEAGFISGPGASGATLWVGLSGDEDADTYTEFTAEYSTGGRTTERKIHYHYPYGDTGEHTLHWLLTGLTANTAYHINLAVQLTGASTDNIRMGGDYSKAHLKVSFSTLDHDGDGNGS